VIFTFNVPDLATTNVCDISTPSDATIPEKVSVVTPEGLLGPEELPQATKAATAAAATIRMNSFRFRREASRFIKRTLRKCTLRAAFSSSRLAALAFGSFFLP
jgi:hypothetical protein